MLKKTVAFLILLLLPSLAMGQEGVRSKGSLSTPSSNGVKSVGWLDPEKFSMSQSYTLSFFSGGGQKSLSGLYLNTLKYRLSKPLSLKIHLGYLHSGSLSKLAGGSPRSPFLLGTELRYRPHENFILNFEYMVVPTGYGRWREFWNER